MLSLIKSVRLVTLFVLLFSCTGKSQNNAIEIDKIFQVFNQWKKDVLKEGTYIETCPTIEEFEAITDTSKYEKLSYAHILPKYFSVSFRDFNGDGKQDALFSYADFLCMGNALGAIPGWLTNRSGGFLLVISNYEGYKIANNEIDISKIEQVVQNKLKATRISISFNEICDINSIRGICKVWSNENDGFLGMCCPDKLFLITINTDENKIWLDINDYVNQTEFGISF